MMERNMSQSSQNSMKIKKGNENKIIQTEPVGGFRGGPVETDRQTSAQGLKIVFEKI